MTTYPDDDEVLIKPLRVKATPPAQGLRHDVTVQYRNTDDGIWLACTCRWELCLGFGPTPAQTRSAERDHLYEVDALGADVDTDAIRGRLADFGITTFDPNDLLQDLEGVLDEVQRLEEDFELVDNEARRARGDAEQQKVIAELARMGMDGAFEEPDRLKAQLDAIPDVICGHSSYLEDPA